MVLPVLAMVFRNAKLKKWKIVFGGIQCKAGSSKAESNSKRGRDTCMLLAGCITGQLRPSGLLSRPLNIHSFGWLWCSTMHLLFCTLSFPTRSYWCSLGYQRQAWGKLGCPNNSQGRKGTPYVHPLPPVFGQLASSTDERLKDATPGGGWGSTMPVKGTGQSLTPLMVCAMGINISATEQVSGEGWGPTCFLVGLNYNI